MTRVKQSMLASNMLRNLNMSYGKVGKLQNQINSEKILNRASDDPVVAVIENRLSMAEVNVTKQVFKIKI